MDKFDLDSEEKNIVGALDRLLINVGMAFIAVIPTYFYLIFKPKALCYMLRGEEPDGRQGLKLGPGVTFILTILAILGVNYIFKGVSSPEVTIDSAEVARKGIRSAISEGNFWRSIILSLPLFMSALVFGVGFHISHLLLRKNSNLTQAVGIGFYALSTIFLLVIPIGVVSDKFDAESAQVIMVTTFITIAFLLVLPWQMFSFSRYAFGNSKAGAAAVAGLGLLLMLAAIIGIGIIGASLAN